MNLFQEMGASIGGVSKYPGFLGNKKGKVFWYGVLVVTIFFVLANIRGIVGASIFLGTMENQILKNVPDFQLESGKFYIEKPFYFEEDGLVVDISSDSGVVNSMTQAEWYAYLQDYSSALVIDADGVVLKSDDQFQVLPWPTEFDFSRETLIGWLPIISVIVVVWYVVSYFGGIGMYFFAALFVALVCLIISSAQNYRFTFGQIYILSVYGKTLALFIKGLSRLIGLNNLPFVGILVGLGGFAISCVYVSLAMALIDRQRKAQLQMQNQMNGYMY